METLETTFLDKEDIEIISLDKDSQDYPLLLKDLKDYPQKLYIKTKKGSFDSNIFSRCFSVVGSRKMTDYGKKVTQYFVADLCNIGVCIVSGFMYGIDAQAHISALSVGGKTIAVMPCGHNYICPDFQRGLHDRILANGGIFLSEYEGDTAPKTWTFPRRNRIVAALSLAILVIEAGQNSGSLITANYARKLGRQVFVAPGDIFNPSIEGNWHLVSLGATVAHSSSLIKERILLSANYPNQQTTFSTDTLDESYLKPFHKENKLSISGDLEKTEEDLYFLLKNEQPLLLDEIYQKFSVPIPEIMTLLTSLTIKGLVNQKGDAYYAS
ncbi:MAG TPA: DNA-processing protein DprA [bacterium]|nr:DNA-processing protein DprA [bacterium]